MLREHIQRCVAPLPLRRHQATERHQEQDIVSTTALFYAGAFDAGAFVDNLVFNEIAEQNMQPVKAPRPCCILCRSSDEAIVYAL